MIKAIIWDMGGVLISEEVTPRAQMGALPWVDHSPSS